MVSLPPSCHIQRVFVLKSVFRATATHQELYCNYRAYRMHSWQKLGVLFCSPQTKRKKKHLGNFHVVRLKNIIRGYVSCGFLDGFHRFCNSNRGVGIGKLSYLNLVGDTGIFFFGIQLFDKNYKKSAIFKQTKA